VSIPVIRTAIPKRRFQLGEFLVSVLGEVESGDGRDYRYIAAVAREGEPQPGLFVTAERNSGGNGAWLMRVAMADGSQVVGADDRWRDLDAFNQDAIRVVRQILSLDDEQLFPLA
jgi:hypothetical protein